jgi:hypothetical protein
MFFFQYILAPLIVRFKEWRTADPRYANLDLTACPREVSALIEQCASVLTEQRFSVVNHLWRPDNAGPRGSQSYVSMWANSATGDSTHIIIVHAKTPVGFSIKNTLVTYRREFTDGTTIATANSLTPGIWPDDPLKDTVVCRGLNDLNRLYDFHIRRCARDQNGRVAEVPTEGEGASYLVDENRRTFQRLMPLGYYTFDARNNRYIPTLRGAFLMTWRLLWPLRGIRRRARIKRANAVLSQFALNDLRSA